MVTINLKIYYPNYYREDTYVEVSEEVATFLEEDRPKAANARRKEYRYKAQYSLDVGDGIEEETIIQAFKEAQQYNELKTKLELSLRTLTKKQHRRVKMRFDMGMKFAEIAEAEGVSQNAIEDSIKSALKKMRKYFC